MCLNRGERRGHRGRRGAGVDIHGVYCLNARRMNQHGMRVWHAMGLYAANRGLHRGRGGPYNHTNHIITSITVQTMLLTRNTD